jgi:hypothetical protein
MCCGTTALCVLVSLTHCPSTSHGNVRLVQDAICNINIFYIHSTRDSRYKYKQGLEKPGEIEARSPAGQAAIRSAAAKKSVPALLVRRRSTAPSLERRKIKRRHRGTAPVAARPKEAAASRVTGGRQAELNNLGELELEQAPACRSLRLAQVDATYHRDSGSRGENGLGSESCVKIIKTHDVHFSVFGERQF